MNYIPHTDFERREMLDTIGHTKPKYLKAI